jgi:hypothetical protein
MQALVSIIAIIGAMIFLFYDKEREWAKNIMVMIISVWFPSPNVSFTTGSTQEPTIFQSANHESVATETKASGHPARRESLFSGSVQREVSRAVPDRIRTPEANEVQT